MATTTVPMTTGTSLADALGGLRITGAENPYGIALLGLTQAAPNLYNPYGKPASNFGIALGQALLSGLLGYQAKKQAVEESVQASDLATQLLTKPAAERGLFLKSLQQQDVPTNVMSRLTELSPVLLQNELSAQAEQAAMKRKLAGELAIEYAKQGYPVKGFEDILPQQAVDETTGTPGLSPRQQQEIKFQREKDKPQRELDIAKQIQSTRRTIEDDPITKAYAEGKAALRSARELAQKDSVTATVALKKIAERGFNPGNQVTMQELKAYESVMPILDRYKTWIESKATGASDLTPTAKAELVNAVETVVNNLGKVYNDKVNSNFNFAKKQGWTNDINDVAPFQVHVPRSEAVNKISQIEQKLLQHKAAIAAGKQGLTPDLLKQLEEQYGFYKENL